jgi:O-antigen/teichoic acid export membrane protein
MAMFSTEVMRFMVDARYAAGAEVIPVVSLSYVLLGEGYYVKVGMYLKSRTGLIGAVTAGAAVLNLVANYFLIIRFGMMGAAWATVLGFLAIAVGSYVYSQRVCPLALPIGRVTKTLAVAVAIYLVSRVVPASSLAVDLPLKSLLIAVFPVILWISGCFSSDELATLHSLWTGTLRLLRPAWLRI